MNYRKSKNFGPLRFNLSKKGISTSFGVKGARVTLDSKGKVSRTFSIPGTGIYDRKTIGNISDESEKSFDIEERKIPKGACTALSIVLFVFSFLALIIGLALINSARGSSIFLFVLTVILLLIGIKLIRIRKNYH